jgi:hypothetical protein
VTAIAQVGRGRARFVTGRARVVREVRASGPLAARLRAPLPARGPWLTAVLNAMVAHRSFARPVAVVVDDVPGEVPSAAAFLAVRPGLPTVVRMLTAAAGPPPGGRPPAGLLAWDDAAAEALADGIVDLLLSRRGPWRLDLTGLPLGDPTARALAARLPAAVLANERSVALVDELGPTAVRTTDAREIDRLLPALLPRGHSGFRRAAVRLHAALGAVEVAVVPDGGGLVSLLDGGSRWPWWGSAAGLRTEMGSPLVRLTASGRPGRAVSVLGGTR